LIRSLTTCGLLQQQLLAQQVMQHVPHCLATSSTAVQLAACQIIQLYNSNPHTRHALQGTSVAKALVQLSRQRHPLTASPAVVCIGIMCELRSETADAVVTADGINVMLSTLEEDCAAQVCFFPLPSHAALTLPFKATRIDSV
jgi:hypothetical protein